MKPMKMLFLENIIVRSFETVPTVLKRVSLANPGLDGSMFVEIAMPKTFAPVIQSVHEHHSLLRQIGIKSEY